MIKKSGIPGGQWLIVYDPARLTYRQVLLYLVRRQAQPPGRQQAATGDPIAFYLSPDLIEEPLATHDKKGITLMPGNKGRERIDKVLLYFPFLASDKRWRTITLPAASLFLGSALQNHGFSVEVERLMLPAPAIDRDLSTYNMIGFTLLEDTFLEFQALFSRWCREKDFTGLWAAGGPLVTLNPLQSAYHLPGLNLLVRGEAEAILPGILTGLANNDLAGLRQFKGWLFQRPGLLVMSRFDEINQPKDFSTFSFNLDFTVAGHLENGLEINLSRGCRQGCLFCSKIQGRSLRKLPVETFAGLLAGFTAKLSRSSADDPAENHARTLNINDDDILQDVNYAAEVFNLVKKNGFALWGIQTSPRSLFDGQGRILQAAFDRLSDRELFANRRPLVWLGTDTFLKERARRLGKWVPGIDALRELLARCEEAGVSHYHYWIASDQQSTWEEFFAEFLLIYRLHQEFTHFSLLPHSPFLVPYSSTPLFSLLSGSAQWRDQVRYKKIVTAEADEFVLPLVERVQTPFPFLNRLLSNERLAGGHDLGFFDALRPGDYRQALIILYSFLKQERLAGGNTAPIHRLLDTERKLELILSDMT